jgi:hypothetical protein
MKTIPMTEQEIADYRAFMGFDEPISEQKAERKKREPAENKMREMGEDKSETLVEETKAE